MQPTARRPIRLIVADLDGTLLNSNHVVSPLTERAIQAALARGVLFTVATGKTFPSTIQHINEFNIQIPVICANGTLIHAPDGSVLHEDPIPLDCALDAVQMGLDAGMAPIVYAGHGLISPVWDANVEEIVAHHEPHPAILPDILAALKTSHKPHKLILMNQNHAKVAAFQTEVERAFEGRAQVLRSGLASVIEVLPLGITKGTALAHLLEHLGIAPEETITFGDNCNDLDMIRRAGIGVAMAHAPEDLHKVADYVTTTHDEDGVGLALQKFVLSTGS